MAITFIVGGARSGKSSFAEQLAQSLSTNVAYLATAQALDEEMEDRIKKHRIRRPKNWTTFEEPFFLANKVKQIEERKFEVILLDCLTLFISNVLLKELDFNNIDFNELLKKEKIILNEIQNLVNITKDSSINLIIVSNEVGLGLVPGDTISRVYRDIVGRANQELANQANQVISLIAGIPLQLKPGLKVFK